MAISAGAAGAWAATNATTQTVTLPTHSAGQMLLLVAACKSTTPTNLNIQVTTPASGWTRLNQFADGTLTSGNGTGSVTQALFYKIAASSSETNPVVTWGGGETAAPGIALAQSFSLGANEDWVTPVYDAAPTTNSTAISVVVANTSLAVGDWGVVYHTTRDDSVLTSPSWTAATVTLSAVTEYPGTAIASGTSNDMAGDSGYRSVTAGSVTGNITATGTQAAAETGISSFVKLRVTGNRVVTPPTVALTTAAFAPRIGNSAYAAAVQALAPVAYWRLGEPSGTSAFDWAGPNVGTYVGTPTLGATGALTDSDKAVTFNGSSQYITVPDNNSLDLGDGPLSYALWWKRATDIDQILISKGTNAPYIFYDQNTDKLDAGSFGTGSGVEQSTTIADSNWHFIVFTKSAADVWKLYIDGTDRTGTNAAISTASTAVQMVIGAAGDFSSKVNGSLDEVALFATELTSGQVSTLYTAATTTPSPTVTPPTVALTLATFAPTIAHQIVGASPTALTTATFAPVIKLQVTPTTAALTLTTFAPTVSFTAHQTVTPATLALTTATFAPVIKLVVTPATASLTTATFAPRLDLVVIPSTTAVALTTFAPTVSATAHVTATPTTAALTTATFAPTVATPTTVTPSTAALTLTTFSPTVATPVLATPTTASLTVTTFAPAVTATAHQVATPTTASLVTTPFAPTVSATANQLVTPTTLALTLSPEPPSVTTGGNVEVVPDTATLTLTTFAPTVSAIGSVNIVPTTASLTLTRFAPTVTAVANVVVTPTTKALTLTAFAPVIRLSVTPTTASLSTSTFAPTISVSNNALIIPGTAALSLTTFPPDAIGVAPLILEPTTGSLVMVGYAPLVFEAGPIDFIDGEFVVSVPVHAELAATNGRHGRLVVSTPYIKGGIEVD